MTASTFGKYEIRSKLASGGMAVTYKALMRGARGVKKPVVLKLIHPHLAEEPEFVEMFIEEARLSATLTHSNIAQVFDFGELDGRYFIAMELVDGQSLAHAIKRARRKGYQVLPVPVACLVAVEMCEALYYAHTRTDDDGQPLNLVHRDVSPENVLVSWQGEVKLVDFGIAKSTMTARQTATGTVKGKYMYFSPEQARADRTVDARTDIYAASVVLYEMLCARRPHEGEFVEVMQALVTGDFPLPTSLNPAIPVELEQLILKGLALDRDARFRTAREMAEAINGILHTQFPGAQRSDLQSFMSVLFEADLKASGKHPEIRPGFREVMDGKPTTVDDKTPPSGAPAVPATAVEPVATHIKTTGSQKTVLSLDTPEKAAARARITRAAGIGAAVLLVVFVVLAIIFGLREPEPQRVTTPVWVTSVPSGASVTIDGDPVGTTPVNGHLTEGTYTVVVMADGYRPFTRRARVKGTSKVHIAAELVAEVEEKEEPEAPQEPAAPPGEVKSNSDEVQHLYNWPLRSFAVWPRHHTVALNRQNVFELELNPDTTYSLSTGGSIDLGRSLGKTSSIMYYAEGPRVLPAARFGFLSRSPQVIKGASMLYAWVFDDDPSDNRGRLPITIRISKYVPERSVVFDAVEHTVALTPQQTVKVRGLDASAKYRLIFRPDYPTVEDVPVKNMLCLHESTFPLDTLKRYRWYDTKFVGEVSAITGLTCMYVAWSDAGTGGVVEVDIERKGDARRR